MHWLGYGLGIVVGTTFGVWLHRFWEHDLAGVGAGSLPAFDAYVPAALFALGAVILTAVGRRRRDG